MSRRPTHPAPALTPEERIGEAYHRLTEAAAAFGRLARECLNAERELLAFRAIALPLRGTGSRPSRPPEVEPGGAPLEVRGSWLRKRRIELGLSQADLATVLGLRQEKVSALERETVHAPADQWAVWADELVRLERSRSAS